MSHRATTFTQRLFLACLIGTFSWHAAAAFKKAGEADTTPTSQRSDALNFLKKYKRLAQSRFWPNVKPGPFMENLEDNITNPLHIYEGSNTNFCGYAALSYLPLNDDPLGYARAMIVLYQEGQSKYGRAFLAPPEAVRKAAGTLRFKGVLDVHPADQLWFLSLADHFKGYLNFFNHDFDPEDEDSFWASVNYAKFNRMIRVLFNYKVQAKGSDLLRPCMGDLYSYLEKSMKTGTTLLYLNNASLYRKKHFSLRPGVPTHYLVLLSMYRVGDLVTITYWDYGRKSLRQVTTKYLKKIIFGITHCTLK